MKHPDIEMGSKWLLRGREVTVRGITDNYPQRGPGIFILAVPNRTPAQRKNAKLGTKEEHHFTDWVPVNTFLLRAERIVSDG